MQLPLIVVVAARCVLNQMGEYSNWLMEGCKEDEEW